MASFQKFTDIEVWQKARELTQEVYRITKRAPFSRDFELRGQIRSASISVMSNIAEGFDRNGNAEFIQFLSIAKGSIAEVLSQLYAALDQGYITQNEFENIGTLATSTGRKIGALMTYLKRSGLKGTKFR